MTVDVHEAAARDATRVEALLRAAFEPFQTLYTPEGYAATVISATDVQRRMTEGPVWLAHGGALAAGTLSARVKGEELYIRHGRAPACAEGRYWSPSARARAILRDGVGLQTNAPQHHAILGLRVTRLRAPRIPPLGRGATRPLRYATDDDGLPDPTPDVAALRPMTEPHRPRSPKWREKRPAAIGTAGRRVAPALDALRRDSDADQTLASTARPYGNERPIGSQ